MAPLPTSTRALLRLSPHRSLAALSPPLACTSHQRRHKADIVQRTAGEYDKTPAFDSPFRNVDQNPTTKIPDFGAYKSRSGETTNRTFQYFMVGSMGILAAAGAKATVQGERYVK
ncbi:MAG: hypothetical protein Q9195_006736 [Heterodermia aff. obscurata]